MARFTESDIKELNRHYLQKTICIAKDTIYKLTNLEYEWCFRVGTAKIFAKAEAGMRNYLYNPKNGMSLQEKEAMAIAAELVVSRLLDLDDFDESEAINNKWCDFVVNDRPIDVKSTPFLPVRLNVNFSKANGKCDLFVLIHQVDLLTYVFKGSIDVDLLIEKANFRRTYYSCSPDDLMEFLMERYERGT